jgi:hypothetical protein
MVSLDYEQTTDTHLSKKYNDALFSCMMTCNSTGFLMRSSPHIETLISYYAAIDNFYNNTFFLFERIMVEVDIKVEKSVSQILLDLMEEIQGDIQLMKTNVRYRTENHYFEVVKRLSYAHKLIMFGLQKRQMLVRESQQEPRGKDSIQYWNQKVGFKKGHILSDIELKGGRD